MSTNDSGLYPRFIDTDAVLLYLPDAETARLAVESGAASLPGRLLRLPESRQPAVPVGRRQQGELGLGKRAGGECVASRLDDLDVDTRTQPISCQRHGERPLVSDRDAQVARQRAADDRSTDVVRADADLDREDRAVTPREVEGSYRVLRGNAAVQPFGLATFGQRLELSSLRPAQEAACEIEARRSEQVRSDTRLRAARGPRHSLQSIRQPDHVRRRWPVAQRASAEPRAAISSPAPARERRA